MRSLFLLIIFTFTFVACNKQKKLQQNISKTESELKQDTTGIMNYSKAQEMIKLYTQYATNYPTDTLSPYYFLKAADVAAHAHQPQLAISFYDSLIINFPKFKHVADAYFFKAFLYDNVENNKIKASETYQQLLVKFPNYHQAETVRWLLQNMFKTDLEIAHELMRKQNDSLQ
jgi:tetratricopeptide (TPR) repeat protein